MSRQVGRVVARTTMPKKKHSWSAQLVPNGILAPNKNHPIPSMSPNDRNSAVVSILKVAIASWLSESEKDLPSNRSKKRKRSCA